MLVWLLRGFFGILIVGVATSALIALSDKGHHIAGIAALVGILATGVLTVVLDVSLRNKQITTISAVYFGLLLGFLLGSFLATAVEPLVQEAGGERIPAMVLVMRFLI